MKPLSHLGNISHFHPSTSEDGSSVVWHGTGIGKVKKAILLPGRYPQLWAFWNVQLQDLTIDQFLTTARQIRDLLLEGGTG